MIAAIASGAENPASLPLQRNPDFLALENIVVKEL
jgi:hypothetical protein